MEDTVLVGHEAEIVAAIERDLFPHRFRQCPMTFANVLAITIAIAPERESDVWDILRHSMNLYPTDHPMLDTLVGGAFRYYRDHRRPYLTFTALSSADLRIFTDLANTALRVVETIRTLQAHVRGWREMLARTDDPILLRTLPESIEQAEARLATLGTVEEHMTAEVYECGKRHFAQNELRSFFALVYGFFLGQADGPRLPVFICQYGPRRFYDQLNARLAHYYLTQWRNW
jgi:lysyl-tRNA synthetase class I